VKAAEPGGGTSAAVTVPATSATASPAASPEAAAQVRMLREMVAVHAAGKRILPPAGGAAPLLHTLLDGAAFLRHAYPGVDARGLPPGAPTTLHDLLSSSSAHHQRAVAAAGERALAAARSVIARVKARAAAAGEAMDAEAEKAVLPTAFAEGFAREIPSLVRQVLAGGDSGAADRRTTTTPPGPAADAASAVAAPSAGGRTRVPPPALELASPYHVLAATTYVAPTTFADLLPSGVGWAHQAGPFAGDDAGQWRQLVADDCEALWTEGEGRWSDGHAWRLRSDISPATAGGASGVSTRYTWCDPTPELEAEQPALSELVQRLHAMPYQFARTAPDLRVSAPAPGRTLVRRWTWRLPAATAVGATVGPLGLHPAAWTVTTGESGDGMACVAVLYVVGEPTSAPAASPDGSDAAMATEGEEQPFDAAGRLSWALAPVGGEATAGGSTATVRCGRGNELLFLPSHRVAVQPLVSLTALRRRHRDHDKDMAAAAVTLSWYTVEFFPTLVPVPPMGKGGAG